MEGIKITIEVKGEKIVLENAVLAQFTELVPVYDESLGYMSKKPTGKIITVLTDNVNDRLKKMFQTMIQDTYQ